MDPLQECVITGIAKSASETLGVPGVLFYAVMDGQVSFKFTEISKVSKKTKADFLRLLNCAPDDIDYTKGILVFDGVNMNLLSRKSIIQEALDLVKHEDI